MLTLFKRLVALSCAMAWGFALAEPPVAPQFEELGHDLAAFDNPDVTRLAVADFDHDGKDDLAFAGWTSPIGTFVTIHIVGRDGTGTIRTKQSILTPWGEGPVRLLAYTSPGDGPHLVLVGLDGLVREWSGWPLHEARTFSVLTASTSAAIGDVDGDGTPDLVVRTETGLAAYSLATTNLKWSIASGGGGDLMLAQLDADNALEIVLAGTAPGRIIDGATQMEDWSYPDSFGDRLVSGRFGSPAARAFAGSRMSVTVFSSMPYSPLWDYVDGVYFNPQGLAVADVDGDGIDEILYSDTLLYGVRVLDSVTHEQRPSYPFGSDCITAMTSLSIDGNGSRQIAVANRGAVGLLDATNGAVLWSAQSRSAPQAVATIGDVDGDGSSDLVTAAGFVPWNRPAGIEVRSLQTGVTEWLSSPDDNQDVYATAPYRLLVLDPVAPSQEKRILIAGTAVYDGRVLIVGGRSHTVYLKLGAYASDPFYSRAVKDAVMVDMDGDGVADILAASEPQLSWVSGAMLHAYSQTGDLIWESVGMGSDDQRINGVLALAPELGAGDNVVAVLPSGLRAYGRLTHLLNWTMNVSNNAAFLVRHGATGAEIGIESGNSLSFYDVPTRTLLRQFALDDTIDAVKVPDGHLERLLVSSGGRLRLIDGNDGSESAQTDYLGGRLAQQDQLAVEAWSADTWRIGAGSDAGVFRYRLDLSERIFASGMESTPQ